MTTDQPSTAQIFTEKARINDVGAIQALVEYWSKTDVVLPRTEGEIYETLRDFIVARDGNRVVAAGALHIEWKDLAEIKSLVVDPEYQGKGLGSIVVEACLDEAVELGLKTIFALTTSQDFFEKCGFTQATVSNFPLKVWNECLRCPKYSRCDEIAVAIDLSSRVASH
jgi:amino-acid N-acetyltransferase